MLLTTALLFIYSVYAFLIGSIEDSVPLLAGGVIAVVATYGVAMLRPWSRYLVYLLTAGFVAKLGYSIYSGITSGYFDFQFGSANASLKSLAPSLALAAAVAALLLAGVPSLSDPARLAAVVAGRTSRD